MKIKHQYTLFQNTYIYLLKKQKNLLAPPLGVELYTKLTSPFGLIQSTVWYGNTGCPKKKCIQAFQEKDEVNVY